MKRTVAVVTLLFAFSLMALAHGKEKHVMGTVTNISDTSITVETTAFPAQNQSDVRRFRA